MNDNERAIFSALEGHTELRYNQLERKVVYEREVMSPRTFRKTLNRMVTKDMVIRTEISRYNVTYSVQFEEHKYEVEGIDYFNEIFGRLEKQLELYTEKREHMSKIEQAELLSMFIKSLYLMKLRFEKFSKYSKTPKIKKLRVRLQDLQDLSESMVYESEPEEFPNTDIAEIFDRLIVSESFTLANEFDKRL